MKKTVYLNIKDERQKLKPKHKLGDLVRCADIKEVFNKGDTENWSNKS